jgi:hypothetical protein
MRIIVFWDIAPFSLICMYVCMYVLCTYLCSTYVCSLPTYYIVCMHACIGLYAHTNMCISVYASMQCMEYVCLLLAAPRSVPVVPVQTLMSHPPIMSIII